MTKFDEAVLLTVMSVIATLGVLLVVMFIIAAIDNPVGLAVIGVFVVLFVTFYITFYITLTLHDKEKE